MSEGGIGVEETFQDTSIGFFERPKTNNIITIPNNNFSEKGRLTPEGISALEQKVGYKLIKRGGGTTKDIYISELATDKKDQSEIFLLLTSNEPEIVSELELQAKFYKNFSSCETFKKVVVNATKFIEDQTGRVIGMAQQYFGVSLPEFLRNGGVITKEQIDKFCEDYRKFIAESGVAHGDLVYSYDDRINLWNANWENIRIDPHTGELRLIDYNGKKGGIAYLSRTVYKIHNPQTEADHQNNTLYEQLKKDDPDKLRQALYQYFGIPKVNTNLVVDQSSSERAANPLKNTTRVGRFLGFFKINRN